MDRSRLNRARGSGPIPSEESALDLEKNCCGHHNFPSLSPPLQPFASAGQHSESSAAYFSWPASCRISDAAEERANYFANLQKGVLPETLGRLPQGQQATTLLELMTIRAFHSKILRCYSLGTAIGFRIRKGVLTDVPAILVFVSRKVHKQWLTPIQCLPTALEGPGGVWCDVDVVEFSYFGAPEPAPKEQLYTEIVDDLRGNDSCIGSGSQVASQETYGTLGAIVRSQTGNRQIGFLTNRHVAVDLDYPSQKMFHPLPPNLGPGVYLGAVERATSFITDDLWYGIFAGINPEAVQEQIAAASATAMNSAVGDSSPPNGLPSDKSKEEIQPLGLHIQHIPAQNGPSCPDINSSAMDTDLNLEEVPKVEGLNVEHQFIPSFVRQSPLHKTEQEEMKLSENLSALRNGSDEDLSLQLGDNELKRRRSDASTSSDEPNKQKLEL